MSGRQPMAGFLVLVAVLGVAFFTAPASSRPAIWISIGLASMAAVAVGVLRHHPRRQSAWWLIVAALGALTAGETTHVIPIQLVPGDGFPAIADVIYLVIFVPLLAVGMWRLVRSGTPVLDRAGMIDVLVITAAAAVVSWGLLIDPLVADPSTTFVETLVAGGYPISGVLVLAIVFRLAAGIRLTMPVPLLLAGVSGMVLASAAYGVTQLQMEWRVAGPAMVGWLALFGGWGATALHPGMGQLTEPRALPPVGLTRARLIALAGAAFLAPLILLIEAVRSLPTDMAIQRGLVMLLFLFVLARLYTAVDYQLRGSARERGMRCASAALVAATSPDQVADAVRAAVRRLLPAGALHEVVIEMGGTVVANGPEPGRHLSLASARRSDGSRSSSIHPLDPPLAGQPGIPGAVLRCPLATPAVVGDGQVGALYVAADSPLLVELETSLEVVATQAAMALERIRLTGQINQHASEQYFRTLIHNAADVILIVDDDDTIRYASPSAAAMLGVEQPVRLTDLVAPEDRLAVERTLRLSRTDPPAPVTADWTVLGTDGSRLQAEAFCRDLRGDRTVAGLVITLRDVTEQRRLQRELTHLAFHDPLTGLANRALLRERLERALDQRAEDGTVVGVLFLDVDDLKAVNDTLGHAAGDELLAETGRRLARAVQPHGTAARLGGDEFAALVVGAHSPQQVEQVAHELVSQFAQPYQLAGRVVSRAVSVGVATTLEASSGEDLLRQADQALYLAKSAGKAQVRRYGAVPLPARVPSAGLAGRPPLTVQVDAEPMCPIASQAAESSEVRLPHDVTEPGEVTVPTGMVRVSEWPPRGEEAQQWWVDLAALRRIALPVGRPFPPDPGDRP